MFTAGFMGKLFSNPKNRICCEDRGMISFSTQRASFGYHVRVIVFVGAFKQMARIVAGWRVATVTYVQQWLRLVKYLKCQTWDAILLAQPFDMTVSMTAFGERPNQALSGVWPSQVLFNCSYKEILTGFGILSWHLRSLLAMVLGGFTLKQ
jgi:hypothetical protein